MAGSERVLSPALDTTPVVILGLGRGVFHHGVLGIGRSLGRLGIAVHRVGRERSGPAARSRYIASWRVVPPSASDEETLELLRGLGEELARPILIAADDAACVFVEDHTDELQERFLLPRQPVGLVHALSSKRGMYELCHQHGIPTPQSFFPQSEAELLELARAGSFPIVLKCINAAEAPTSAPRVLIASDIDELTEGYRQMETPGLSNVMLQEYVPGTPETVWMFNGYFDDRSVCRVGFTGRKIRQSPPYTGATTLGVCLPNETVQEVTERFMQSIGYRGILDIGYRFDERDGEYKLLDVNPRIGGTFRLFVGDNGIDVLRALHLDLNGRDVPATELPNGRRWIVEPLDITSSIVYRRRGDIRLGGWLRSFRGVREGAWWALDDPLPFLALWPRLAADRALSLLGRS
jgi:predicted ATP-grasp superfamily ATP-dependent carboligase